MLLSVLLAGIERWEVQRFRLTTTSSRSAPVWNDFEFAVKPRCASIIEVSSSARSTLDSSSAPDWIRAEPTAGRRSPTCTLPDFRFGRVDVADFRRQIVRARDVAERDPVARQLGAVLEDRRDQPGLVDIAPSRSPTARCRPRSP